MHVPYQVRRLFATRPERKASASVTLEGLGTVTIELSGDDQGGRVVFADGNNKKIGSLRYTIEGREASFRRLHLDEAYRMRKLGERAIMLVVQQYGSGVLFFGS